MKLLNIISSLFARRIYEPTGVSTRQPTSVNEWIGDYLLKPPVPQEVKHAVMRRHSMKEATWIETGTHLGETAEILAGISNRVITLEPSSHYYALAIKRLSGFSNVEVINKSSEEYFGALIERQSGSLCLWLDGHYSGGETFRGARDTPLALELQAIKSNRKRFESLVVLIDDFRLSYYQPSVYPSADRLAQWARSLDLNWTIEADIFIAKSRHLPLY